MRKTIWASMFALATFAVGNEARAQQWGLHTGDTVRTGDEQAIRQAASRLLGKAI